MSQETYCDREPITKLGAIQPHGVLLAVDPETFRVLSVSSNWPLFFKNWPSNPLNRLASELFSDTVCKALHACVAEADISSESARFLCTLETESNQSLVAMAHLSHETLFVEFELNTGSIDGTATVDWVSGILRAIESKDNVPDMMDHLAKKIRKKTGYERILIYRFDTSGDGEVVAEDKTPDWDQSLLGLRFPAGDIPRQARALYLKNRIRVMPIRDYVPVKLFAETDPRTGETVDLSMARLRSVSPIHLEYQKNLGIDGSLSVSIVIDNQLWGLLIGQHRQPHAIPIWLQVSLNALIKSVGYRVHDAEQKATFCQIREAEMCFHRLLEQLAIGENTASQALFGQTTLLDLINANGALVLNEKGEIQSAGCAVDPTEVRDLVSWVKSQTSKTLWSTDSLPSIYPKAEAFRENASGILIAFNGLDRNHALIWLRSEESKTVTWAGDPANTKQVAHHQIHPRTSFERWVEIRRGWSEPWQEWEIRLADDLRQAINEALASRYQIIRILNEKLEESNEAKSRFLAAVSHELRTPLNAVIGFSEVIKSGFCGPLAPKLAEYVDYINDAGLRQLNLVQDILEVARASAGPQILNFELVDITSEVNAIVKFLEARASQKNIQLKTVFPHAQISTRADKVAIGRCLDNLITNAIKFSPKASTIVISIKFEPETVQITVSDQGSGIPASDLADATKPFTQINNSTTYLSEGLGLGLSLVESLAQAHGGCLILSSIEGAGTDATIVLPNIIESEPDR